MDTTPPAHPLRGHLQELARVLRALHKTLIEADTPSFGEVGSPLEHLQLVTTHPHFAWLLKLSGVMTALDEQLDEPELPVQDAARDMKRVLEGLIGPAPASDAVFRQKYSAHLLASPDVMMAHAALRQVLARLG